MHERAISPAIAALRARIAQLEGDGTRARDVLPFGIAPLDHKLPGGGLALLHLVASVDSGRGALVTEDPSTVERLLAEGRAATLRTRWSLPVARPHHGTATAC